MAANGGSQQADQVSRLALFSLSDNLSVFRTRDWFAESGHKVSCCIPCLLHEVQLGAHGMRHRQARGGVLANGMIGLKCFIKFLPIHHSAVFLSFEKCQCAVCRCISGVSLWHVSMSETSSQPPDGREHNYVFLFPTQPPCLAPQIIRNGQVSGSTTCS